MKVLLEIGYLEMIRQFNKVIILLMFALSASAQTQTLQQIYDKIDKTFPNNTTGKINIADARTQFKDIALLLYQRSIPDDRPMTRNQVRAIIAKKNDLQAQMIFVKDLQGSFIYDALDEKSIDDGVMTLVSSSGRRYRRIYDGFVNLQWFAKGDGNTDDTQAIQQALNYCNSKGAKLFIPAKVYKITKPLSITLSTTSGTLFTGGRRFALEGESMSGSCLRYYGTDISNAVLRIVGNYDDYLEIKNINIVRSNPTRTGKGLQLERLANFSVSNVHTAYFDTGITLIDVNEGIFTNIITDWNKKGLYAGTTGEVLPNVLHFNSCAFNSNTIYGCFIDNGCSNTFTGCRFLVNGNTNSGFGLKIVYGGYNGKVSTTVQTCYFEDNGKISIQVNMDAGGSHNFIGNSFHKTNNTHYATTHIEFNPINLIANDKKVTNIVMLGNSTFVTNNYTPNSERKDIILSTGLNGYNGYMVMDRNYYDSTLEAPLYGINVIQK